ncbi:NUDIX hydrolase [Actinocorallia populi]|uniref:NUDIX hydrolase n=1 Tax=Actinocorallia populi TaxID=2079200 RepID=UPI0018E57AE8|nr:NUDIX hydrolase [Actinocorallia populi]
MTQQIRKNLRVAAYGICVEEDRILLARFIGGDIPRWTLPGGGLEHGEDPVDGALRELTEETGYTGRVVRLLGVHSLHIPDRDWDGEIVDHQSLRIVYEVQRTGGELRHEVDNSTDRAEWFRLSDVPALEHVALVDVGLGMWRDARGG